ncbi:class I SAM-dependent methyltransferase [Hoeflea olei]|uniref:Methyltransferase type 12 n=1 Tax=Hoeflea olei TaxID=1480615 RepID=A0A1C1YTP1_9HYPH|nr:class I SAM-dependent methyltransferase [Hoeflea olei]OCW56909.1 hypothetical protein AWJ14_07045 [Hoeflea olei]
MSACNVCGAALAAPVYRGGEGSSITTMNVVIEGQTEIFHCRACDHVQTAELPDLERYYAEIYSINEGGEDDDQLYEIRDGREIYRSEHQAAVALEKLGLSGSPKVLDYGSAKGATLRRIVTARPDVVPYLFDVTDKYRSFWGDFPVPAQTATHRPDPAWAGSLDVVMSFYALEHIPALQETLAAISALLRPGGTFYFLVPNMHANPADFIVADHVNHFSRRSLTTMLERAGFSGIEIDESAHAAAFVVTCKAARPQAHTAAQIPGSEAEVKQLAAFWSRAGARIGEQEASLAEDARIAIYGAGVYGHFILSSLTRPDRVACFLDRNRFLRGTRSNGLEVRAPEDAPADLDAVFVGLNPLQARAIMDTVEPLKARKTRLFFLD